MIIRTITIITGTTTTITALIITGRGGSAHISMVIRTMAMGLSILRGGMIPGIIMAMAAVIALINQ